MFTPAQCFFFCVLIIWGIYIIVNRICKCLEHRATAQSFDKLINKSNGDFSKVEEQFFKNIDKK